MQKYLQRLKSSKRILGKPFYNTLEVHPYYIKARVQSTYMVAFIYRRDDGISLYAYIQTKLTPKAL